MVKVKFLGHKDLGDVYKGSFTMKRGIPCEIPEDEAERLVNTFGKESFEVMKPMVKETNRKTQKTLVPKVKEAKRNKTLKKKK